MSGTGSDKPTRGSRDTKPDYGVFDPDRFWGHVLTGPTATDQPDTFDARVERAWQFVRVMFFKPEEYGRMREVLVRMIAAETTTGERL